MSDTILGEHGLYFIEFFYSEAFMKAVKKLFIACSVIMMFACVTLGTLSLQPVKANAATA